MAQIHAYQHGEFHIVLQFAPNVFARRGRHWDLRLNQLTLDPSS